MHRLVAGVTAALLVVSPILANPPSAQGASRRPAAQADQDNSGQPPHAWLFGTWTGGLFPPPSSLSAEACLSQPVVIFTRDLVLRATLTDQLYIQRVIETALNSDKGVQFRFTSAAAALSATRPLGTPAVAAVPPGVGFGCENPDELTVERHTENQITFPGCGDFPYPLLRCPSR